MNNPIPARHLQRGLSLIELMVTLVLGLIIIAAVFNMFISGNRSAQYTEGLQSVQENGRYAVSVVQRGLRLAGYSPDGAIDAFVVEEGGVNSFAVQSRQAFDCNGADTSPTQGVAVNTYRHNASTNQLTCEGNQSGASPMALVENVEQFRVLYGVDTDGDSTTLFPQSYVPYAATLDPEDIVSVRFSLLIRSGEPIRTRPVEKTYVMLDEQMTLSDRRVREVFSSTVKLRNRQ